MAEDSKTYRYFYAHSLVALLCLFLNGLVIINIEIVVLKKSVKRCVEKH